MKRLFPVLLLCGPWLCAAFAADATPPAITVYKSPTCGCCSAWSDYLSRQGFDVKLVDTDDMQPIKRRYGVEHPHLQSCHTALVDGYVIEGHVPAHDIFRLLAEAPSGVTGLTAPGMPAYSPGMMSEEPRGYDVLSFDRQGNTEIYSRY